MADRKKRYVWLKLEREFFRRKEIKKLRRQAGGDTYAVIVLEMALLSLENDGILVFSGLEDDMYEEIALELDEEAGNVRVALDYLLKTGWAEILDENTILLTCTVNRIGSESESAGRMRKLREKRRASQCDVDVTPKLHDCVTSDTEGEEEKEEHIEVYQEEYAEGKPETEQKSQTLLSSASSQYSVENVVDDFNSICTRLTRRNKITDKTREAVTLLTDKYLPDEIRRIFVKAQLSSFLCGSKGWKASFEWLIDLENAQRVLGGQYDD
ncbi:phage replisome organizer N-terminal domain-containing protein [Butyricicoccus sp.]|uniref:phage replisome organizer N-terminal domain-containing protein n=1 Tax=Butyricicoccus sp. TaxID=2049021 RepID=UPI003F183324